MTRQEYRRHLDGLIEDMLKMGSMSEKAVLRATDSLRDQNTHLAQTVLDEDDVIDQMEVDIEEQCIQLIALQQPLAGDLRTVSAILKVITDLERIGDHADNIAELTLRIAGEELIKPLVDIPRMATMAESMVRKALESFVQRDTEMAREICRADDPVDDLYSELYDELLEFVRSGGDAARANQAINLLFAARYLERIADHATNIAERVIYMVEGKRVPHQLKGS